MKRRGFLSGMLAAALAPLLPAPSVVREYDVSWRVIYDEPEVPISEAKLSDPAEDLLDWFKQPCRLQPNQYLMTQRDYDDLLKWDKGGSHAVVC